jgi:hypothetical protein
VTRILRYDAAGSFVGAWRAPQQRGWALGDLAFDRTGRFLYATAFGTVHRFDLQAPTAAIAAAPQLPAFTGQPVAFDASASSLELVGIGRYEWDLDGDGTFETDTGSEATVSHAYREPGEVTARVRVTGFKGGTDTASVAVTIQPSSVEIQASPPVGLTGETVTFSATGSPGAAATSHDWDLDGDGAFETHTGATPTASRSYATVGSRPVSVRVTRPGGRVDSASMLLETRPAPPAGFVGISVQNGARFTNSPDVTLHVVWPRLASTITTANDGGFAAARTSALTPEIPWTLDSSPPERLPKTVYARFDGVGPNYTDDIVLDETRPVVRSARVVVGARRKVVRISARDNVSGVAAVQTAARSRKRPRPLVRYRSRLRVRKRTAVKYVRVVDRAGNYSRWKRL